MSDADIDGEAALELAGTLRGDLLRPGEAGYDEARTVWNGMIDLVFAYIERAPSELSTVDLWILGDAVSEVPQDATAFRHRDKPFTLDFEANWKAPKEDDANVEWAREGLAVVEELQVATGRYGNFPGFAEDPTSTLFGENYDRLVEVKTKYDPENLFRVNQNVAPHTGAD